MSFSIIRNVPESQNKLLGQENKPMNHWSVHYFNWENFYNFNKYTHLWILSTLNFSNKVHIHIYVIHFCCIPLHKKLKQGLPPHFFSSSSCSLVFFSSRTLPLPRPCPVTTVGIRRPAASYRPPAATRTPPSLPLLLAHSKTSLPHKISSNSSVRR